MKISKTYYEEKLYPFQDGVLSIVASLGTRAYLTGGTALSRHYLGHRYSDDLDFFFNRDEDFSEILHKIHDEFAATDWLSIDESLTIIDKDFGQFILVKKVDELALKIDVVNDIAAHFGDFERGKIFPRIDSLRNIISNKITALGRLEAKDFIDLWAIRKRYGINWTEAFTEARQKDPGVDPVVAATLFREIPDDELKTVRFSERPDREDLAKDFEMISNELLKG